MKVGNARNAVLVLFATLSFASGCMQYGVEEVDWGEDDDALRERLDATRLRTNGLKHVSKPHGMVEGKGFRVPEHSSGTHALVGARPDRSRADSWGTELTGRQVEIFENIAGQMLSFLGYDLKYGIDARKMTAPEKTAAFLKHKYKVIVNMYRFRRRLGKSIKTAKDKGL